MKALMLLAFSLLLHSACTAAPTSGPSAAPDLIFSWVDCRSPELQVFEARIWRDGRASYTGKKAAKIVGEKVIEARPSVAQRAIAAGIQLLHETDKDFEHYSDPTGNTLSQFCLSLSRAGDASPVLHGVLTPHVKKFSDLAERVVGLRDLVCPVRSLRQFPACTPPAIFFVFEEDSPCFLPHVVRLFETGDVIYTSDLTGENPQYAMLTRDQVISLMTRAESYHLTGEIGMDERGGSDLHAQRGSPSELSEFRQVLTELAHLNWASSSPGSDTCAQKSSGPRNPNRYISVQ